MGKRLMNLARGLISGPFTKCLRRSVRSEIRLPASIHAVQDQTAAALQGSLDVLGSSCLDRYLAKPRM
jgi:hypothetical protein